MKRVLLSLAALLVSTMTVFADDVVTVKTGSETVQFDLDGIERINFGDEAITVVEKSGSETPFFYDDISEITFDYIVPEPDSISLPEAVVPETDGCDIYSISGKKMNPQALPNGVYIIKKGNKTTKFVKR